MAQAQATVTIASGATWQEVAADRQAYRDATIARLEPPLPELTDLPLNTIPIAKQVLSLEEISVTESSVEELAATIAKGQLSAVTVTKAFLRRAGLAQKVVRLFSPPPNLPIVYSLYLPTYKCSTVQLRDRTHDRARPRTRSLP